MEDEPNPKIDDELLKQAVQAKRTDETRSYQIGNDFVFSSFRLGLESSQIQSVEIEACFRGITTPELVRIYLEKFGGFAVAEGLRSLEKDDD